MELKNLEAEILRQAEGRAKAILREAESYRQDALSKSRERVMHLKAGLERQAGEQMEKLEVEQLTKARMQVKQKASLAQKQLVDSVYESFMKDLQSQKQRHIHLKSFFDIAKKELGSVGAVYVNQQDMQAAKKLFKQVSIKPRAISGGLIAESPDSSCMVDLSFDALLEIARERSVSAVNQILFGNKNALDNSSV